MSLCMEPAQNPSGPRPPSRFFAAYDDAEAPPWDIGRPQPAFVDLEARGLVRGPVVDVGCGTGENALYLATRGHEVAGVDLVPRAIDKAREKAAARGLAATFAVGDALALEPPARLYATAIDSGVFHVFDDADRVRYVASLAGVVERGGHLHILVFSDREPTDWGGPRRVRREEIEHSFTLVRGWTVQSIEPARFHSHRHGDQGGEAWLARIERA